MKIIQIFILLVFLNIILYNDIDECYNANKDTCSEKNILKEEISCFNFKTGTSEQDSKCYIFPSNKGKHEKSLKIINALNKEKYSAYLNKKEKVNELKEYSLVKQSGDDNTQTIEAEIIGINNYDSQILSNEKTCSSYLTDFLFTNYIFNKEENIKQDCFNSSKLKDSENLLECGYGEINFESPCENPFAKACFLMPDFTHVRKDDILIYFFKKQIEKILIPTFQDNLV